MISYIVDGVQKWLISERVQMTQTIRVRYQKWFQGAIDMQPIQTIQLCRCQRSSWNGSCPWDVINSDSWCLGNPSPPCSRYQGRLGVSQATGILHSKRYLAITWQANPSDKLSCSTAGKCLTWQVRHLNRVDFLRFPWYWLLYSHFHRMAWMIPITQVVGHHQPPTTVGCCWSSTSLINHYLPFITVVNHYWPSLTFIHHI